MGTLRDKYIRKAGRCTGLLRLERHRRSCFLRVTLIRNYLSSLLHDSGLSRQDKVLLDFIYQRFSSQSTITKHNSRCRSSGRSRQVSRKTIMARMHFKQLAAEGQLTGFYFGKFKR